MRPLEETETFIEGDIYFTAHTPKGGAPVPAAWRGTRRPVDFRRQRPPMELGKARFFRVREAVKEVIRADPIDVAGAAKINLMSAWSREYAALARVSWEANKVPYAAKHGYGTVFAVHPPHADIMWHRPKLWLDAMEALAEGSWLLFTGADALIMHPEMEVERFIDGESDFICCVDRITVFSDVWLMRSCPETKEMLREMLRGRVHRERAGTEQDAFTEYLFQGDYGGPYREAVGSDYGTEAFFARSEEQLNHSPVRVRLVRPGEKFTGDPREHWPGNDAIIPPYHAWTKEHFILHLGGKTLEYRLEHLPCHLPKIT